MIDEERLRLARHYYNNAVDWRADSCRDEIIDAYMAGYEQCLDDCSDALRDYDGW